MGIYKSVKRSPSHLEDDSAVLKRSGKHGKHGSLSFGFGVRPSASSLFDLFDDMSDLANSSIASKAFPVDVEDKGDGYEVKAYLTGVAKDDIDVELNEGRLSISVNVEEDEENEGKNFLQKEFSSYSATRGVYLKDASSEGLSAKYADGILTVTVPKIVEKKNVTKISID